MEVKFFNDFKVVVPTGFEPVFEYDYDFALFFNLIRATWNWERYATKTWRIKKGMVHRYLHD